MDEDSVQNRQGQLYLLGARGYSAYEVAVLNGYTGTEEEWLASLKGEQGEPGTPFGDLTPAQKEELRGPQGKSAYQISVDNGFVGTEQQWVNSFLTPDGYYNKDAIDTLLDKKTYYFTNVATMKLATNLKDGDMVVTLGYYEPNDGGEAEYYITDSESLTDYQEELNSGLYATLIVENDILNVKQLGAKADNTTDNTSVFNKALSYVNRYTIYFPYGYYKTSYLNSVTTNTNIKIYGDNANIKLLDNVITADSQRLFAFACSDNINILIEIYGLNIDMNRTNNHSVVDSSGDSFALQHCHAIFVYGSANSNIDVMIHDITFNDLIADGVSLGGGSTKIVNNIIVNNIISKNRAGTRSDVCITCDFDSLNCSNMILDKFEIEVNSVRLDTKRTVLLNNLELKDTLDLDIGSSSGKNVAFVNNVRVEKYFYNDIENITYSNCYFKLNSYIRLNGIKIKFENCDFTTKDNTNFIPYSNSAICYIYSTRNDQELSFTNCKIKYNNAILSSTSESQANFLEALAFAKLEFNNCDFDISSKVFQYRGGETHINNCTFKTSNEYVTSLCSFGSNTSNVACNIYLKDNKTSNDISLFVPSISGSSITIYENNPGWIIGKVLRWTRFDKITSFNGGSGSIVTVKEFTEFLSDSQPNSGIWIKGQRVKNSNPSTDYMWICTSSGSFGGGTAPTFSAISI